MTLLLLIGLCLPVASQAQDMQLLQPARQNTSQPLTTLKLNTAAKTTVTAPYAVPNKFFKFGSVKSSGPVSSVFGGDKVLQTISGSGYAQIKKNFEGSSDDDNAAVLGFRVVPPDTEGDIGPNHYVQWINSVSEIFDRNGNSLVGPFPGNLYFQGMGGICETTNNGDPIVLYDESANRWLVSQFALDFGNNTYSMCIGISTTPDPTGSYHQYEFSFGNVFPDYPKLGIWGDSYTLTTRNFINAASFGGLFAVALDRHAMLSGNAANGVAFTIPAIAPNFFLDGYLPVDADDAVSGPALFAGVNPFQRPRTASKVFEIFALDVDWNNPAAASFGLAARLNVPDFNIGNARYIEQPNGQLLDDLDTFTMHRAQLRDFGSYRAIVANHTVKAQADAAGIRWYELRDSGGGWSIHQSGTFSPDTDDRWMGSIAMNGDGDIALGYSKSSSSSYPSIYVTGQTANYSGTGTMNIAETLVHAGGGSQEGASRWGDYSMMSVDPQNDETFWYTTEYYAETGAFDFKTRIASFNLHSGGGSEANPGPGNEVASLQSETPQTFAIAQNYPNPFNPTTMVTFDMPEAGAVSIKVYNTLGQEVATLVNEVRDAGQHRVSFNASDLSAGVYLYVMEAGDFSATKRMTLLK